MLNSDEHTGRRTAEALASVLGISTKTIERVRRQFCEEGMGMFESKVRKTRSDQKIDGRVEAHLTALLCQSIPDEKPKWERRMLADWMVDLQVVEHISTTMLARLLEKRTQALSGFRLVGDSGRRERGLCLPDGASRYSPCTKHLTIPIIPSCTWTNHPNS